MTLEKFRKELYHLGISSQTFNSTLQLQLQQFNMDIENFSEDQFYEQEPLVIEIPENFFDNLIQLEEPGEFNEFELPQDIWEEHDDVEIEEHPDLLDPIYRRSEEEMSSEEGEEVVDSAYVGWHTSEEEEEEEQEQEEEEGLDSVSISS